MSNLSIGNINQKKGPSSNNENSNVENIQTGTGSSSYSKEQTQLDCKKIAKGIVGRFVSKQSEIIINSVSQAVKKGDWNAVQREMVGHELYYANIEFAKIILAGTGLDITKYPKEEVALCKLVVAIRCSDYENIQNIVAEHPELLGKIKVALFENYFLKEKEGKSFLGYVKLLMALSEESSLQDIFKDNSELVVWSLIEFERHQTSLARLNEGLKPDEQITLKVLFELSCTVGDVWSCMPSKTQKVKEVIEFLFKNLVDIKSNDSIKEFIMNLLKGFALQNKNGSTAWHLLAMKGGLEGVLNLLSGLVDKTNKDAVAKFVEAVLKGFALQTKDGWTAWHLLAMKGGLEGVLNLLSGLLDANDKTAVEDFLKAVLKDFELQDGDNKGTAYHLMVSKSQISNVLNWFKTFLNGIEDKDFQKKLKGVCLNLFCEGLNLQDIAKQNGWHHSAAKKQLKGILEFLDGLVDKTNKEAVAKFVEDVLTGFAIQNNNGATAWHELAAKEALEGVLKLLDGLVDKTNKDAVAKFVEAVLKGFALQYVNNKVTAYHVMVAASQISNVLNWFKTFLNGIEDKDFQKKLKGVCLNLFFEGLKLEDIVQQNVWHYSASKKQLEGILEFLDGLVDKTNKDTCAKFVEDVLTGFAIQSKNGSTAWHWLGEKGALEGVLKLLDGLVDKTNKDAVAEFVEAVLQGFALQYNTGLTAWDLLPHYELQGVLIRVTGSKISS